MKQESLYEPPRNEHAETSEQTYFRFRDIVAGALVTGSVIFVSNYTRGVFQYPPNSLLLVFAIISNLAFGLAPLVIGVGTLFRRQRVLKIGWIWLAISVVLMILTFAYVLPNNYGY